METASAEALEHNKDKSWQPHAISRNNHGINYIDRPIYLPVSPEIPWRTVIS